MTAIKLSTTHRALLDRLQGTVGDERIPRRPKGTDQALLSFGQERMWFLDKFQPGLPLYTMIGTVELIAPSDVNAVRRALEYVVNRHEALRTVFDVANEVPVQIVLPPHPAKMEVTDLRNAPTGQAASIYSDIFERESRRVFDLSTGPLIHAHLVLMPQGRDILLYSLHHIVSDGWSMGQIRREITEAYELIVLGRPPPAKPPALQYPDFSIWQRNRLAGDRLTALRSFWGETLAGARPVSLPAPDHPSPKRQTVTGANRAFRVQSELVRAIDELGLQEEATTFMILLAALTALFHLQDRERDWVIGTPVANRETTELEELVGFVVNTIPIRIEIDPAKTFREFLKEVRQKVLSAFDHQALPFEQIVDIVQPERNLSHNPLFQIMVAYQNMPDREVLTGEDVDEDAPPVQCVARFALGWFLAPNGDELVGSVEYSTELYEHHRIVRMVTQFKSLLQTLLNQPDIPVTECSLLPETERAQLERWSLGPQGDSREQWLALHEIFERSVDATPDKVALAFKGETLTYHELDRRAEIIADNLVHRGVGAEDRVAVCLQRGVLAPAAIIGILKAGGTCVPLDPALPDRRLAFMLADSQAKFVIIDDSFAVEGAGCQTINIAEDLGYLTPRHPVDTWPQQLAYIVYTSGSTGQPKGVALPHGTLSNLIRWQVEQSGNAACRTAQFASPGFDVSFQEMFSTWGAGGCLCIVPSELRADPRALADWLCEYEVTRAFLPPLVLRELAQSAEGNPPLRQIIAAGEALQITTAVSQFCARSQIALVNHYGPSETHVVTSFEIKGLPAGWPSLPPIGSPIPACRAYVLGPDLSLSPIGAPGELYLAGAGMARGYHGRPELTAERFLPDPFGPPGTRMYRTGDLARWSAEGEIEFLGRNDSQVKIRGFRVELQEIEVLLRECPGIEEAVVLQRDGPTGTALIGYYESVDNLDPAVVRAFLRDRLPDYMIPGLLLHCADLPRLANGKIDRLSFSDQLTEAVREIVPPRSSVEERLARIWVDVLGVERVGINESFFELGGHSLLATRLVSRTSRTFGVDLAVIELFENPTIAELAGLLELRSKGEIYGHQNADAPEDAARDAKVGPLSFGQDRLWFIYQLSPGSSTYNLCETITFEGPLSEGDLKDSWLELSNRHPGLRTRFIDTPDGPRQEVLPPTTLPWRIVSLEEVAPTMRMGEIDLIRARERAVTFDLTEAPPISALVAVLSASEHVVVLTMHHIVADGWSLGTISREWQEIYNARRTGRPPALADLPPSAIEFALAERALMDGPEASSALDYWRDALSGAPAELDLPLDRPRNREVLGPGALQSFALPVGLDTRLESISLEENASMFMVLLAGFAALLARYDRRGDFPIGVPVGNRENPAFESTIGFFVNTLVVRARVRPRCTFRELVREIRQDVLQALANQRVPFERIVEEVQPFRSESVHPLFQVMFFLNHSAEAISSPGELEVRTVQDDDSLQLKEVPAKFDLTLGFETGPDGLIGGFEYRTDLFEHWTIWRMSQVFRRLIDAAVSSPDTPLDSLELQTDEDRNFAREALTGAELEDDRFSSLTDILAKAVQRHGDRVAIDCGGLILRYAELWSRALALAEVLRCAGVQRESAVGVMMRSSPDYVVAIIGTMLAGGAYLPIDPDLPSKRRQVMQRGLAALIVASNDARAVEVGENLTVIPIDQAAFRTGNHEPADIHPDQAAYIIYTSGSVGEPRPVVVPQRAVAAYVEGAASVFGLTPESRVLQFASPSFDVAVEEIFATLAAGATLVMRSGDRVTSVTKFVADCHRDAVEVLIVPTAFWHQLVPEFVAAGVPSSLKLVVIGGEQAGAAEVALWHDKIPREIRLLNAYGPTEATVSATYADLTFPLTLHSQPPIGRPVSGVCIYVLDEELAPVPAGLPGELYIAGITVARGYQNDPAATALRFIPNPFGSPGSRMYSTGDRVILRGDGQLTFVGRNDAMVKVRGFRVELGEIEAALRTVSGKDLVAAAYRSSSDDVVAVIECDEGSINEFHILKELSKHLPHYMIPTQLTVASAIPLSAGGKPDRRAVAAMIKAAPKMSCDPPRGNRELAIAEIWTEVIGTQDIARDDDFFALGGHSLMAMRIVTRLRDIFGVDLSIRQLFEARTIAALAALLPDVTGPAAPVATEQVHRRAVTSIPATDRWPASFAQERLLFIHRLTDGLPLYNLPIVIPFEGPLNPAALRSAVAALFERHHTLRTFFSDIGGQPFQHVADPPSRLMDSVDLADVPVQEREAELARIAEAEAQQRFDLENGHVARALLVRVTDARHVLFFTLHHIVADGWSVNILRKELKEAYDAFSVAKSPPFSAPPTTYAEYSAWQRIQLGSGELDEAISWWTRILDGANERLPIPHDRPRPIQRSFEGRWQLFSISSRTTDRLKRLAETEQASLFMALMTVFQIVVAEWAEVDDIVTGTPLAGREDKAVEGVVGTFVNTVPIRTRFSGHQSYLDVLRNVRETSLGAFAHGHVPYEKIVEEIGPERSLDVSPLFQVLFALQNLPHGAAVDPDHGQVPRDFVGRCTAKYDLSVSVDTVNGALVGYCEYAAELFRDETIRNLIDDLVAAMDTIAENPHLPVDAVSRISPERQALLTTEWAMGPSSCIPDGDVLQDVASWAERSPHAEALCDGDVTISYGELADRASAIAAWLHGHDCGPDSIIAVCIPRSAAFVVACTGIMWSGAAFLPIDPSYPPARRETMLMDSGASLVLYIEGQDVPHFESVPALKIDRAGRIASGFPDPTSPRIPPAKAHPDQLAYVIYTSGSTGAPKGVAVPHGGLRNLCRWFHERFGHHWRDRVAFTATPSFDAAISEIWPTLSAGAALDVMSDATRLDPALVARWLRERKISICFLVTPLAEAFLDEADQVDGLLRILLTGGDRLTRRPPPYASFRLFNLYGPTECTVCASGAEISADEHGILPIGRPICNARCYVLDDQLDPVAPGKAGQLFIAGLGLARGYLQKPGLTAVAFLPDPYGPAGSRMYATGDRVRWVDGTLYFLGRLDRQVKVRGIRIELEEVEAALTEIAASQTVVRVGRSGELIGYFVGEVEDENPHLVRLRACLPAHMVPARLRALTSIPITRNGKIDDEALERLDSEDDKLDHADACTDPNPIERKLASLWSELLKAKDFHESDDFFASGGHSLLLTQLAARIRLEFGVELPLRVLFQNSTIQSMALEILARLLETLSTAETERAFAKVE